MQRRKPSWMGRLGSVITQKGFSLIELLIAVFLLAVTALSLMALFPSGYREITKAGRLSVINHLAQQKLDELIASGYSSPDLLAGLHPTDPSQYRLTGELSNYSMTWEVFDNVPLSTPATKTVVVEVGYLLYNPDGTTNNGIDPAAKQSERFVVYIAQ